MPSRAEKNVRRNVRRKRGEEEDSERESILEGGQLRLFMSELWWH